MSIVRTIILTNILLVVWLSLAEPGLAQGGAAPSPPTPAIVSGEIVVKFKAQIGTIGAQNMLRSTGFKLLAISPHSELVRVQVTPGHEVETLVALAARPDIEFASYNYQIYALVAPNDPEFSRQWSLHNTGQTGGVPDADIDGPEGWDIHPGSSSVTIAIIDTGVDLSHEDLQANIWLNGDEIPANGLDDDLNGYIDDYQGYDFYNNDSDPADDHSHGSHVAGIAAASGNNSLGITGVSWAARIMPLKILSATGGGSTYDLQEAIYYAADNGANIINMSLGAICDSSWGGLR